VDKESNKILCVMYVPSENRRTKNMAAKICLTARDIFV